MTREGQAIPETPPVTPTPQRMWGMGVDWGFLDSIRREPKLYVKPRFWRDPFTA